MSRAWALTACVWLAAAGCERALPEVVTPAGETVRFSVYPPVLSRGTEGRLEVSSTLNSLVYGATEAEVAEGVALDNPTVLDSFTLRQDFAVAADAPLGPQDLVLDVDGEQFVLEGAITVVDASLTVSPPQGKMGQLLEVTLTGTQTAWVDGRTWADFGPDIRVVDVAVSAPDQASALIAIADDAPPGPRDIAVVDEGGRLTAWDGFLVDRDVITAVFDPPTAKRGDTVSFTLTGRGTTFDREMDVASLVFWNEGGPADDLVLQELTWIDPERLSGKLVVSNAAWLGGRDLFVNAREDLLIDDAITILDAPVSVADVAIGTSFTVRREVDPSTGAISEAVNALAYFIIPLQPACGSSAPPSAGPMPFDISGAFPVPEPAPPDDCPPARTVSAGDVVWFEGPQNVVPLYKEVNGATGQILYRGRELVLDDYRFGSLYALRTQGDPDGVPELLIPDVQPTVPADYTFLAPSFVNLRHPRTDPLELDWTPAETYPSAVFSVNISGTLSADGEPGYVGVLPWDDGHYTVGPARLAELQAGGVSFSAVSATQGPYFGLPGSRWINRSSSSLTTSALFTLE